MDDNAIICVSLVASAVLGAVVGKAIPNIDPNGVILVTISCGALGAYAGYTIFGVGKSRRKQQRTTTPKPIRDAPPKAFRKRLAEYTGRDETEVMSESQPYKSRMPFWIAVDVLVRVPPKTARVIRRYLISIRDAVRRRNR